MERLRTASPTCASVAARSGSMTNASRLVACAQINVFTENVAKCMKWNHGIADLQFYFQAPEILAVLKVMTTVLANKRLAYFLKT